MLSADIYILLSPPLFKVRQGKAEQYLKDEQELDQFLVTSALDDARLLTKENGETLSGDTLGNIAREMVLTEAVIRRLSSRYDETLIRAIHQMGAISLQNEKEAQAYVEQLKILMTLSKQ